MQKKLIALIAASAFTLPAYSATVSWGAGEDNGFSLQDGSNLPVGSLIRIGVFTGLTDSQINALRFTPGALESSFTEIANARIGEGIGSIPEHFAKSSTRNDLPSLAGAQIYMWAFASTNNSSVALSLSTATQHGIFYADKALIPRWTFPSDSPVPGSTTIDITDLSNVAATALVPAAHVVVGNFPNGVSDASGSPNFGLLAVPEPASIGLFALGSVGLLARRRRPTN